MSKTINNILIANRGEIALRALRTIHKMGKKATVIYSKADKDSAYVSLADHAVCVGPAEAAKSYLNIPNIVSAAELIGCDAIFPGYGFLSENQYFADVCVYHGINFIGPSATVMGTMADKSKARATMKAAGVPVIQGSDGTVKDYKDAIRIATQIGYPVILKASAGGGGKGMRVVNKADEMKNAYLAASSEAFKAFGDGSMYLEQYIGKPRHIEVQVLVDKQGHVLCLGERDCSLQRRHQKLVEESPAIILDEANREKLHQTTIKACQAIKYENAGTFEFLLDENNNFYFIEMNTRLQVEHTVSEEITGIDIVELMINIAEGKPLPSQNSINFSGHAIECRITAEDPDSFIPSPGKIVNYKAPGGPNVRLDSHCFAGYVISSFYDSMIAKLIVKGKNRDEAIALMRVALAEYKIEGIKNNISFHIKMMDNPDFINNNFDTKYLQK